MIYRVEISKSSNFKMNFTKGKKLKIKKGGRADTENREDKTEGEEEDAGGLWEDGSRSGCSGKAILGDGDLVPKEAFNPKSVARSIRNMARSRSRSRSLPPLRRRRKDGGRTAKEKNREEEKGDDNDGSLRGNRKNKR